MIKPQKVGVKKMASGMKKGMMMKKAMKMKGTGKNATPVNGSSMGAVNDRPALSHNGVRRMGKGSMKKSSKMPSFAKVSKSVKKTMGY